VDRRPDVAEGVVPVARVERAEVGGLPGGGFDGDGARVEAAHIGDRQEDQQHDRDDQRELDQRLTGLPVAARRLEVVAWVGHVRGSCVLWSPPGLGRMAG
jgi:hypothetical protein